MQRLDPPILGAGEIAEEFDRRIAVLDPAFVEQRRGADEVADIGDHPRLAGFNEGVLLELLDILLDHISLQVDDIKERAQGFAALLVALADEGRKQAVEAVTLGVGEGHARRFPALRRPTPAAAAKCA